MQYDISMPLAKIPDLEALSERHRSLLAKISDINLDIANRRIYNCDLGAKLSMPIGNATSNLIDFEMLKCRLSTEYIKLNGTTKRDTSHNAFEIRAFAKLINVHPHHRLAHLFTMRGISRLSTSMGGGPLRTSNIYSARDRDGYRIVYPSAELVPHRISEIQSIIIKHGSDQPIMTALVCAVLIFNIHPLRDGNGRLGRLAYNIIIASSFSHRLYLPLSTLFDASCGGINYATRMAWMKDDWGPIIEWFSHAYVICHSHMSRSEK